MAFPRLLLLLCSAHPPITLTQGLNCLGQLLSCLVHSLLLKSSNEHKDNICCVMGSTLVLLLWQALSITPCVTSMFCVCFLSPLIDNYNMKTLIDNYNTITTINKYNMITTNNMILPEQLSHHLLRWHSRPRAEKNVVKTNLFRPFCTEPGLGAVIAQKSFTQKVVLIKYFFVWWFVTWDGFTKAPGFFSIASSLVPWWGASSSSYHKNTLCKDSWRIPRHRISRISSMKSGRLKEVCQFYTLL